MSNRNGAPPAASINAIDLQEEVIRLREEVSVLREVMDEIREELASAIRGYRPDDWQPIPVRPIVSMPVDVSAPDFAQRINDLDPATLPDEIPQSVRSAVAMRLRESQGQGVDSLTQQQRLEEDRPTPLVDERTQQRALWDDETLGDCASKAAEVANGSEEEKAPPVHRDRITVTRIIDDPERPDHTFLIRRGDRVKAYFSKSKQEHGTVAGISHANEEVRVRFDGSQGEGIWFGKGSIYPPDEIAPNADAESTTLSNSVECASQTPPDGFVESDRLKAPYTLADFETFNEARRDGNITADAWKESFRWLRDSKDTFLSQLVHDHNAKQLKVLAARCGSYDAGRNTKQQNAESVYRAFLQSYTPGTSFSYQPMSETFEEAATRQVDAITDDMIAEETRKRSEEVAKHDKALSNPENLTEFYHFIQANGIDALSDEQFALWDRLHAEMSREQRKNAKQSETVEQFRSAELAGVEFQIIDGFHEKKQVALHIVQLTSRVERSTFNELKIKAKQLGGWWSSFKKASAGFQFVSREAAEKFVGLTEGNVDSSEEQLAKKLYKMDSAAARLNAVADTLESNANAILESDETKLKNTERRARMAAGQRADAHHDLATAATLRSVASSLSEGEATFLDRVWNSQQIKTLKTLLWQAQRDRIRHQMETEGHDRRGHAYSVRYDELEGEPYSAADVWFATYPKPYLYKQHLIQAVAKLQNTRGVIQVSAKMEKRIRSIPSGQDYAEFNNEHDIALLEEFLSRAKASGYDCYWFDHCLDAYKRLRSANLFNGHELRMALRELVPHLRQAENDDPVKLAEDELRGKKLDGFFPTPRRIIEQMLDLADIGANDRVLEPSAGKGDILDAVRKRHPDVELKAIEQNHTLAGILAAKGHEEITTFTDFLSYQGPHDRILMNPPFENGADSDHVRHAYELLSVGGRLVSVMSKGPFFRSDAKSREFREWLDSLEHDVQELPEDAFQGSDSFRQTGVRTALVVIDKPS